MSEIKLNKFPFRVEWVPESMIFKNVTESLAAKPDDAVAQVYGEDLREAYYNLKLQAEKLAGALEDAIDEMRFVHPVDEDAKEALNNYNEFKRELA